MKTAAKAIWVTVGACALLFVAVGLFGGNEAPTVFVTPSYEASAPSLEPAAPLQVQATTATDEPLLPALTDDNRGFTCSDGSVSHALHRRGACSHHGGVR